MVALQRQMLQSEDPGDETFVFRRCADFQFFIVGLRRLRQAALLAAQPKASKAAMEGAIGDFDKALPDLQKMRRGQQPGEVVSQLLRSALSRSLILDRLAGRLVASWRRVGR